MVNFGHVALFGEAKPTTFSGKHLAKLNNLHAANILRLGILELFEESENTMNNKIFVGIKLIDSYGLANRTKMKDLDIISFFLLKTIKIPLYVTL